MRWRELLIGTTSVMLVVANIIAVKIVSISVPIAGTVSFSAGVFPIAIAFLCTDIISELYGKKAAFTTVVTMITALVLSTGMLQLSVALPYGGGVPESMYNTVIDSSLPLVFASITTAMASQSLDVALFHRIREITGGQYKFIRNIGSTAVSQLFDTALFTVLAFAVFPRVIGGTTLPLAVIGSIVLIEYGVKMLLAVIDTPVFYAVTQNGGMRE